MSDLYNATTKVPEVLPEDQIGAAIASGSHAYPVGTQIKVNTPNGDVGTVPSEQLQDAVKQGYTLRTGAQEALSDYQADNAGLKGTAKQFTQSFLNQAAFGIPEVVQDHTEDQFDRAKRQALATDHGAAELLGGSAGFGISLFYGGEFFQGAAKANALTGGVLTRALATAGVEAGSEALIKRVVAKAIPKIAGGAAEGMVISAPRAITEAALGDTDAAAESLISGGLIGTAFGGAHVGLDSLKGVSSGVKEFILNKVGAKAAEAEGGAAAGIKSGAESAEASATQPGAESATAEGEASAAPKSPEDEAVENAQSPYADPNDPSLMKAAADMGAPEGMLRTISKATSELKENSPQIRDSAAAINIGDLPEIMLSNNKTVQNVGSVIANQANPIGMAQMKRFSNVWDKISGALDTAFGERSNLSARDTGDIIKQGLKDSVNADKANYEAHYKAAGVTDSAKVGEEVHSQVTKDLQNIEGVSVLKNAPDRQLVNQFIEQIPEAKTLGDLEDFIKSARSNNITDPNLGRVAGKIKEVLENAKDTAIENLTNARAELEGGAHAELSAEGKKVFTDAQDSLAAAKAKYRETRLKVNELSAALGKSSGMSPSSFESFLDEKLSSEDITRKLFTKNDSRFLDFLKKEYPQQYETLMNHHRSQFINAGMLNDQIDPSRVFRNMNAKGMTPEIRSHLLADPELYEHARVVREAIPNNVNPSGTDVSRSIRDGMSLKGKILETAGAHVGMKFIKNAVSVDGILATEQAMKSTAEGLDRIPKVFDALERGSAAFKETANKDTKAVDAIFRLVESAKDPRDAFKKLSKNVAQFKGDPGSQANSNATKIASALSDHGAPTVAQTFTVKMQQAMSHMDEILPKPVGISNPLNPREYHPSDKELSEFRRRLTIMIDPMSALDDLKSGKLTQGQVQTLQTVYPKIYAEMQQRMLTHISEKQPSLSYQNRLKLSLFLGTSLDPSLSPQTIQGYQSRFMQPNAQQPTPTKLQLGLPGMTDLRGAKNKGT
jgi:hypothetical protein